MADYIVLCPAPDLPEGWLSDRHNGVWFDRLTMPRDRAPDPDVPSAVAMPTGRYETRDDGAVAEVWEVRPVSRSITDTTEDRS